MKLLGQYTALVHGWGTSARCALRPVCVTALGVSERYPRNIFQRAHGMPPAT